MVAIKLKFLQVAQLFLFMSYSFALVLNFKDNLRSSNICLLVNKMFMTEPKLPWIIFSFTLIHLQGSFLVWQLMKILLHF